LRESKLEYRDGLEKPSNMLYNRFRVPALAWKCLLEYCVHTDSAGFCFDLKTIDKKICGRFLWSGPDMVQRECSLALYLFIWNEKKVLDWCSYLGYTENGMLLKNRKEHFVGVLNPPNNGSWVCSLTGVERVGYKRYLLYMMLAMEPIHLSGMTLGCLSVL